jgi:hypothetical protein
MTTSTALTPSIAREGTRAGLFTATGVAALFFILDAMNGRPFETPSVLGLGLARALGLGALASSAGSAALLYGVLHYAAFIALAIAIAAVVRIAQREATVLAGALLVLAVGELAFCGMVALLGTATMPGAITWLRLAFGNILGWALLGGWMWRTHPELGGEIARGLDGTAQHAAR